MLDVEYNRKSGPMPPTVHAEELCVSPQREKACYKTGKEIKLLILTSILVNTTSSIY